MLGKSRLCTHQHFNPRAPRGARHIIPRKTRSAHDFNPRAPRGARPCPCSALSVFSIFQSTRSARSATDDGAPTLKRPLISIHALREERDPDSIGRVNYGKLFQSTRSARSATSSRPGNPSVASNFNPRAPRGARRLIARAGLYGTRFQSTRSARSATRF